jgi:hypothetical protein
MFAMPEIRVGEPLRCGALAVFPLFSQHSMFSEEESHLDYLLAHEAMERGAVAVTEVSEAGSVPEVLVRNNGNLPVLFLEGVELRGAMQNRTLNTTVLAGGRSHTRIPVSCVEPGRWRQLSRKFRPGSHCPPSLRSIIKDGTIASGGGSEGRHLNQCAVWTEIQRKHRMLGVSSETGDMSAALESRHQEIERMKAEFPCPAGANGIAVAMGGNIVCMDILDKAATLKKFWSRVQEGLLLDLLEKPDQGHQASADVSAKLYSLRNLPWHEVQPVGLGDQYRTRSDGVLADALLYEGSLLHASISLRFPR